MKRARKTRSEPAHDDGHTVANMNVEGMPWYQPNVSRGSAPPDLTRSERIGIVRLALTILLPFALGVVGVFWLVLWLLDIFWLK